MVDMADRTVRVANGWATQSEIMAMCGKDPKTLAACVTSYDYQILRPSGSGDDKAVLAARVTKIRVGS